MRKYARLCKDCNVRFSLYTNQRNRKYYFCPMCGENVNVVVYDRDIRIHPDAPKRKDWTTKEERELERYIKKGYSTKELATKFGRTDNAIHMKAKRLGYLNQA